MRNLETKHQDSSSQQSAIKTQTELTSRQQSLQNNVSQQIKIEESIPKKTTNDSIKATDSCQTKIQEHTPIHSTDPDEQDLCKALTLLKNKLPNRGLLQTIKRLYQTVQLQQQHKQKNLLIQQQKLLNSANSQALIEGKEDSVKSFKKLKPETIKLPTKKISPYHDKATEISSISHQFHSTKHSPDSEVPVSADPTQTQPRQQSTIYHFKQCDTLKTNFLNPLEQQKYKQRRHLTLIYIERGYGVTKQIDQELPSIAIDRSKYKNLLGGILTMAYRKLESFILNQCQKTIKYLNREQMKSITTMLLNCRVQLTPTMCDTYFKFMKIGFGIGDVDLTEEEAVELYLGIHKFIHGKNVTMDMLQHMGQVQNMRELEAAEAIDDKLKNRTVRQGINQLQAEANHQNTISDASVKEQQKSAYEGELALLPSKKIGFNFLSQLQDKEELIDLRNIPQELYHEDTTAKQQLQNSLHLLEEQIDPAFLQQINE